MPLAQDAYRHLRAASGLPPRHDLDVWAALKDQQRRRSPGRGIFRFPWGRFEYLSLDLLVPQFEQIFVLRQYSFRSAVPSPVVVDCGGHIGLSAIFFRRTHANCRLQVYEADPSLCRVLRRNLEWAGMADVEVHNKAVWTRRGPVGFDVRSDDTGRIDAAGKTAVDAFDLADELPERVDLLKLDVEGAEFPVVERLLDTGAIGRVHNLVCEFHVTRERTDGFIHALSRLRAAGMEVSLTASVGPMIGLADDDSAFEAIGRNNAFVLVYGWRRP